MATLPLKGIRVLDMTVVWAGPYGTMFLADMGAEVIRVESRYVFPTSTRGTFARPTKEMEARMAPGSSYYPDKDPGVRPWNRHGYWTHSRNKYSITADLTRPEGKEIFRRLVEISDVFIENNAVGAMARLGLTYDVVSQWNPRLIMISSSGMGQTGPWAGFRGFGSHFGTFYGHAALINYPGAGPESIPSDVSADPAAGVAISFATVLALHNRNKTGKGQFIDLAQGENFLNHLGDIFMDYLMNGRVAQPIGNRHPTMVQGCYPCQGNDEWLTISVATDEHWQALCRVMGRPELADDERFADAVSRYRNHDEVDRIITEWTSQHDPFPLFHALQKEGVPAGSVMHEEYVFKDPHVKEREFFVAITHPETGPVVDGKPTPGTHLHPSTVFKMSKLPFTVRKPPVRLGEDNEYVYKEVLGVSDEEYAELEAKGHIGMDYIPEIR